MFLVRVITSFLHLKITFNGLELKVRTAWDEPVWITYPNHCHAALCIRILPTQRDTAEVAAMA